MMKPQFKYIKQITFIHFSLALSRKLSGLISPINALAQLAFQIIITLSMPKEIIYVDMTNQYPFPEDGKKYEGSNTIQVRKTVQYDHQPRFICKEKIRMVKSLGFQNLIGLESTKSEENAIILFFQYVPFQFLAEVKALGEEKLVKIKEQLLQLCDSFASKAIVHDLQFKRVGLDKRYNVKYFLGVDFKIDKTAEKLKLLENYQASVNEYFSKMLKSNPKNQALHLPQIKVSENVISNSDEFQINVRNLLGLEDPASRKMLKKSSIIESECMNDDLKARKASTRFTFNCNKDSQIKLPINEKEDNCPENTSENKSTKKEDLSARINILKGFMKEITVKITSNFNKTKNNENESCDQSSRTKRHPASPNFTQFQKKVNQFRLSRLRKTSKDQEAMLEKDSYYNQTTTKPNPSKSFQEPNYTTDVKKTKNEEAKSSLFNTVIDHGNAPPAISFVKKHSLNVCEDDRQHQEYVMLANKDQYCAQFMLFLEDNEACDQRSQRTVKKSSQNERPSITLQSPDSEYKAGRKKSNLKTNSSENTLEIQSRVQKVIRSSLKLISGLRSRESIRCE